mgnify:CR=1 FL=1
MKTFKCVKAWSRHGLGTVLNEWEYNKLPINIKSGHFQEVLPISFSDVQVKPTVPIQTFTVPSGGGITVTNTPEFNLEPESKPTIFSTKNKFKNAPEDNL